MRRAAWSSTTGSSSRQRNRVPSENANRAAWFANAMEERMSKAIHFYGEKGLVIAALLDLEQQGKLLEFLRSIEFPYRTPTNIEIQDSSEVKVIVEAGFFQFGKPDALITISQSEDDS